jgi:hypothetical protein
MYRAAEIVTAVVLFVSPVAFSQELYRELDGGFELGVATAPAGDVDRDGVPDVILGGYDMATVVSGKTGQVLWVWTTSDGSSFGYSVGGAGDVDADGFDDLIVGAPFAGAFAAWHGSAYLYSGRDGHLLHQWDGDSYDRLGTSVSGVGGDVDGDGHDDVLIGAPRQGVSFGSAYALIVSGATYTQLRKFTGSLETHFGQTVAAAGDLNGDGVPDVLVAETLNSSAVHAYSGLGGQLHVWYGRMGLNLFGASLSAEHDLNGDGVPEVVIGAPGLIFSDIGYVQVFSGATGDKLGTLFGQEPLDNFGKSVALVNDANGDGIPDLIVGAPWYSSSPNIPRAWLFSGATGNALYAFDGDPKTEFGDSVADAGDLDGDGRSEVLIGAPYVGSGGRITWYLGNDLYHHIEPRQIVAGDTVTHTTREGDPAQPTVIFVTAVNGVPRFQLFGPVGFFDLKGTRVLSFVMPPGYSGLVVTHRAFALDASGKLLQSADETVTFE